LLTTPFNALEAEIASESSDKACVVKERKFSRKDGCFLNQLANSPKKNFVSVLDFHV